MGTIRRFEQQRFVGARDTMVVYDTDDVAAAESLRQRITSDRLLERNLLQAFAPDTLPEAENRGFTPA